MLTLVYNFVGGSGALNKASSPGNGLTITEKGNGGDQKSQSMLSENANDFTFRLEETGLIEKKHINSRRTEMISTATAHSTLMEGSVGEEVTYLQQLLNKKSRATIAVDGYFGEETKRMVEIYQRNHGLVVDGIVGQKTWNSLES